jgi:hypothetical protein
MLYIFNFTSKMITLSCLFLFSFIYPKVEKASLLRHVHILGIQSSGTSFIESLILSNIEAVSVRNRVDGGHFVWKHGFVEDATITECKECIFIHVHRNPYDWLRSIKKHSFHMYRSLYEMPFSSWLRAPWRKIYNHSGKVFEEINPETGKQFDNVIQLRNSKLKHFKALETRVPNFYSVAYEAVKNDPESFLSKIASLFSLQRKAQYTPIIFYRGKEGEKQHLLYKEKTYQDFTSEDLEFINSQLDLELEKLLGYGKNQFNACNKKI